MKKTLAILLSLALVICMLPGAAFATTNQGVTLSADTAVYNGTNQMPKVSVYTDKALTENTDFKVAWSNASGTPVMEIKEVGKYTATITSLNNSFNGDLTADFEITALSLGTTDVTLTPKAGLYDGNIHTVNVTVRANGKEIPASDYTVSTIDAAAGKKTITVNASGTNTTGSKAADYSVDPVDLTKATLSFTGSLSNADLSDANTLKTTLLNGSVVNQTLSDGRVAAVKREYLEVTKLEYLQADGKTWSETVNAAATAIQYSIGIKSGSITGDNVKYSDTKIGSGKISVTKSLNNSDYELRTSSGSSTFPDMTYTGSPLTPAARVYDKTTNTYLSTTYYNVSYGTNNTTAGQTVTITASGINGYTGDVYKRQGCI